MKPFTITRDRYTATSTCDLCKAHASRSSDSALHRWQRSHRCQPTEHDQTEEKIDV